MGWFFKFKFFYIHFFKNLKYREYYTITSIFGNKNPLDTLLFFEKNFQNLFNTKYYNYLFESAVYKKNIDLIEYLIDKIDLNIKQEKLIINNLHSQLLTSNLKSEDYFSWLAIIASHSNFHLLGLEKKYDYLEHYHLTSYLLKHVKIKEFFIQETTQQLIYKNCHENAKKMFEKLFLEIHLSNKKTLPIVSSKKINKI